MTKPFDEQYVKDRDAAAQTQCNAAIEVCEKYEYPTSDEPLCLIVDDSFKAGADWCKQYFDAKVEELERKLSQNKCNSGHETLPIVLWDCPECVRIRTEKLEKRIEGLRGALNNITICSSRDSASYDASKALTRDDELRGAGE